MRCMRETKPWFLDRAPGLAYSGVTMAKRRADALLVERGIFESREKARASVLAGRVFVGDRLVSKPGVLLSETSDLRVATGPRFVSRGGDKLDHALMTFGVAVGGLIAADFG